MKRLSKAALLLLFLGLAASVYAIEIRFAPPDFQTDYTLPGERIPAPSAGFGAWDVLILFAALSTATWLVLKKRSRRGLFLLSIACMVYFGFWRKGCICPVGSLQNVAAAILIPGVGVSAVVVAFFVMPLIFSLFFGRVFCASVCPLGAIQELVAIRPIKISSSIERALGLGKYVYLGVAILGVGTGAGFFVCRYDPFVGLYRLGHSFNMLLAGGVILVLGIFIARPYCRFLCPYGVLLGWMSKFSKWHLDIAPQGKCVDCRLCESSCPYNAMDMPTPIHLMEKQDTGKKRTQRLVLLVPVITGIAAFAGYLLHEPLSRMHPTVQLSERVAAEDLKLIPEQILETEHFRAGSQTTEQLHAEALALRSQFKAGGALLGAFLGLVVSLKLVGLSVVRKRTVFEPHRETCFSCGRCYPYCPVEPEGTPNVAQERV
ncbi:MAG: 4Fe-4S binding protein [Candidatus Hydrogenedentes bacterium]|nr:4Fe-4S binding protein [Candidatus Hydrogenedentota bacterium]